VFVCREIIKLQALDIPRPTIGKHIVYIPYNLAIFVILKGQCHEMVVEMSPWSGRLDLMVPDPFFCLKIGRLKGTE
jgi:hypothetical protein